jgi:hypothetical protein
MRDAGSHRAEALMRGELLFIIGIMILLLAGVSRAFYDAPREFTLPLVAGGLAALVFGLYQRWWSRAAFE